MEKVCNHDCFNCLYDDCILDGATDADIVGQDRRDKKIIANRNLDLVFDSYTGNPEDGENRGNKLRRAKSYYKQHRKEINEKKKAYYWNHRQEILDKAAVYRESHREEINRKARVYAADRYRAMNDAQKAERLQYQKERRKRWAENGMCSLCGAELPQESKYKTCERCREYFRLANRKCRGKI